MARRSFEIFHNGDCALLPERASPLTYPSAARCWNSSFDACNLNLLRLHRAIARKRVPRTVGELLHPIAQLRLWSSDASPIYDKAHILLSRICIFQLLIKFLHGIGKGPRRRSKAIVANERELLWKRERLRSQVNTFISAGWSANHDSAHVALHPSKVLALHRRICLRLFNEMATSGRTNSNDLYGRLCLRWKGQKRQNQCCCNGGMPRRHIAHMSVGHAARYNQLRMICN